MFFFFMLTTDQILVFRIGSQVQVRITLGEKEGLYAKAKFWYKLTPTALRTFLLTYWSLGKSLTHCVCNFYNRGCTFWVYCLLKYNWKKSWIHMLNACNWSFFEFLIQEKQILFFLQGQLLQSGAPLLGQILSLWLLSCTVVFE